MLAGGGGADLLDGEAGIDTLVGGAGNDTYVVDVAGDVVTEAAEGGTDTIKTALGAYSLAALGNVENLQHTGFSSFKGTGNSAANVLLGGSGADSLDGGVGTDHLSGGLGNDSLIGGAGRDGLSGDAGNDTLTGCFSGLNGGRGEVDTLTGGAGADMFALGYSNGAFYDDGVASNSGAGDYALIADFTAGSDRLRLDGKASGYYLAKSPVAGVAGTALFAERGGTDELIAIIRSANTTTLTAANTINSAVFV